MGVEAIVGARYGRGSGRRLAGEPAPAAAGSAGAGDGFGRALGRGGSARRTAHWGWMPTRE